MPEVSEHTAELDASVGQRRAAGLLAQRRRGRARRGTEESVPLYLHGVPTNSDDWLPFLKRSGGLAPDLPGFGRSGKPGSLSYTIEEYERFVERFLDFVGVERVRLVVHDWGAVGLAFAQRRPERIERLVVINAIPLLPGYRWHRTARIWRTPVLGELAMGTTNRRVLRLFSRESNATPGPMPEEWLDSVLGHFDQGTQRAILRLYRSSPPTVLEAAGAQLGALRVPALVAVGDARSVHTGALRPSVRERARRSRADRAARRRPLALAGPRGRDRAGCGLPRRRAGVSERATRRRVVGGNVIAAGPTQASAALTRGAGVSGRVLPAWAITAVLGAGALAAAPPSADLAAASYRSDLFGRAGFTLWDNGWYGGHHIPAYSLLAPALGWLIGPRLLAVVSMTIAAALFAALIEGRFPARATRIAAAWFALGAAIALLSWRVAFDLGLAVGIGALLLAQRDRRAPALALAAAVRGRQPGRRRLPGARRDRVGDGRPASLVSDRPGRRRARAGRPARRSSSPKGAPSRSPPRRSIRRWRGFC